MKKYWLFVCFIGVFLWANGQKINPDTIKITGIVLDADSLHAMSNVHIISHKKKGAITDAFGQFSFKINKRDTLTFSYMGFKDFIFVVPDTLKIHNYIAGIILNKDTVSLSEVIILPWMNKKQFKQQFIKNEPDRNTVNATRNLQIAGHAARAYAPQWTTDAMIDMQLKQYAMDVEYKGMLSPNQSLNVIGLAQLIIYYTQQQLTKEEKAKVIRDELRKYIEEGRKR